MKEKKKTTIIMDSIDHNYNKFVGKKFKVKLKYG